MLRRWKRPLSTNPFAWQCGRTGVVNAPPAQLSGLLRRVYSCFGGQNQMETCATPRPYRSFGLWTSPIPPRPKPKLPRYSCRAPNVCFSASTLAPVPGGGVYAKPWRSNRAWSLRMAVVSPSATMCPAFITTVRGHRDLTSARSWVAMSWVG